jgi:hypothetical protein
MIHKAMCTPRKNPANTAYPLAPGSGRAFRIPH